MRTQKDRYVNIESIEAVAVQLYKKHRKPISGPLLMAHIQVHYPDLAKEIRDGRDIGALFRRVGWVRKGWSCVHPYSGSHGRPAARWVPNKVAMQRVGPDRTKGVRRVAQRGKQGLNWGVFLEAGATGTDNLPNRNVSGYFRDLRIGDLATTTKGSGQGRGQDILWRCVWPGTQGIGDAVWARVPQPKVSAKTTAKSKQMSVFWSRHA